MIYLIDEKKERQLKYGWSSDRFSEYVEVLEVISNYEKLKEITSKTLLNNQGNFILLHDSFFKNLDIEEKYVVEFKHLIHSNGLFYVTFGGSFDSTYYDNKILQVKVNQFYTNLQNFLESSSKDLRILAYGNNFEKEEFLTIKNKVWNFLFGFDDLIKLTPEDKFKLLTNVQFNNEVTSVVDKCDSVAEIKTILSRWKI
jgi:hypothetical protein